jgi:cbb3-type cytochrome oxidase subunit 1
MKNISSNFIKTAVLFGLIGMGLGIHMAITHNHNQIPTHAHINLLGWVSMMLYGLYYKNFEDAGRSKLAMLHFWLVVLGAIIMNIGIYLIRSGMPEADPIAAVGSIATILGMVLFGGVVFRNS